MSAKVVSQGACPKCGSSDAYTLYEDGGSHCFSCGYHPRAKATMSGYVSEKVREISRVQETFNIPDDIGNNYAPQCIDWIRQYDLTVEDLLKHNVKWSGKNNQLIFIYTGIYENRIKCIQARNFNKNALKYYTQGNVADILPIYKVESNRNTHTLVIVEDAISAIKVSRQYDAMPLLGSYLPLPKVVQIKNKGYNKIVVWLDHDKYKSALNIGCQLENIGCNVDVVCTDLDPKFYRNIDIEQKVS